ncbi:PepSY-associated TM helix domain-containing protein [Saccharothrix variisporea]|uniref:Putative iron-regulated membrane protein n=1 Tax=Saccharothrix variisporea TaxID=543527 RepID=A0A495XII8_9PSEU|nr:PepSY-associated TM helix domain-containing protein [Saccharothrix variisporea]RKT72584.1 putative iron-regulated membrane protein [Saccharothrix variisporea]
MIKSWRGLVLRFHFYAGVLVGPFVLIAALTGVLYAATPQLESWLYADELSVPASEQTVPLSRQVEAAVDTQPSATLVAVRPAPEPGMTTRVLFSSPDLGESEKLAVFVDPATGAVVGDLVTYGSSGVLPLRATLDGLHRDLLLGEVGRLYSELAASWLWVVALGGLVLWLTRRRSVTPKPALRRHAVVGLWVLVGALFLSATGLTWSKYAGENVADLRKAFGWTTPALKLSGSGDHSGHGSATPTAGTPSEVDAVLAHARAAGIDARAVEVTWPAGGGAWKVAEVERGWPTQVDSVAVHGGVIVDQVRFADYPLMAKLTRWGIDAHMGVLFGWVNQVLLLALGGGLVALVVLGYRMWWRRRPTRGFGRPVPRGQWRKVPPAQVVGVLVVAAAVGWFVPLFGLTLLGFLVVDALLGTRRTGEPKPVEHAV